MKYEHIKDVKEDRFRQVTGIKPSTFAEMVKVVRGAYLERHRKHGGRNRKLSIEDMVLATLEYYKEYRAYECIAASYGVAKQNMCLIIKWVEEVLSKSGLFKLPGKKKLTQSNVEFEVIVVDSTETPIERPKRGQRKHYSGKKNDIQ